MIELTRELLERYGRAVGCSEDLSAYHRWDLEIPTMLMPLARHVFGNHGALSVAKVTFRLGLCAAAEEAIDTGHRWLYERYIKAAGINPEAWEAAK